MKRGLLGYLLILLAAGGLIWAVAQSKLPKEPAAAAASAQAAPAPTNTQLAALEATPQAQDMRVRKAFEANIKQFLRDAPRMTPAKRSEFTRVYTAWIDAYEKSRQLSAGEAMLLRASLIEANEPDNVARAEQIAALVQNYRQNAERRGAEWASQLQNDTKFQEYKSQEREIVGKVMTMHEIPGGMTRDQYLRQQLQEAREQAYK
ncbi:hypothetical protein [Luteimonas panaciterrae]|uniref:hypothetical protein n=1 Tax=Luteimonas panaciterrae TaxID=363885 RepID=UPI001CF9A700|nr:hypothetical protein [Luteimonas panaciterrae]